MKILKFRIEYVVSESELWAHTCQYMREQFEKEMLTPGYKPLLTSGGLIDDLKGMLYIHGIFAFKNSRPFDEDDERFNGAVKLYVKTFAKKLK